MRLTSAPGKPLRVSLPTNLAQQAFMDGRLLSRVNWSNGRRWFARSEEVSRTRFLGAVPIAAFEDRDCAENGRRGLSRRRSIPASARSVAGARERMIAFRVGVTVWIAGGATDTRCGMNSLGAEGAAGSGRDQHAGRVPY